MFILIHLVLALVFGFLLVKAMIADRDEVASAMFSAGLTINVMFIVYLSLKA